MHEPIWIPREQIIRCLRDAGWVFKQKKKKVEIYKKRGSTSRIDVPFRDHLSDANVRVILRQAGFSNAEAEAIFKACTKSGSSHP